MATLKRKALGHYIDTGFDPASTTHTWSIIGKRMGSGSVELNPDTSTEEDITGQTYTEDNGMSPSMELDYVANTEDGHYLKIKELAMERESGETWILEVIADNTDDSVDTYDAWIEKVVVTPTSYGGEVGNLQIPFTVGFNGDRTKGTVTKASVTARAPVFTPT